MLQSGGDPNKRSTSSIPTTYRGNYGRTKRLRNSEMTFASQFTGQTLFDVWGLDNTCDTPTQPLERPYTKVDRSEGAILEDLDTIRDVCDSMKTYKTPGS